MLQRRAFLIVAAITAAIAVVGFRAWPKANDFVGTWEYRGLGGVRNIILAGDHRFSDWKPEWDETETDGRRGTWRIAGPRLASIYRRASLAPEVILTYDADRLATEEASIPVTWFRDKQLEPGPTRWVRVR